MKSVTQLTKTVFTQGFCFERILRKVRRTLIPLRENQATQSPKDLMMDYIQPLRGWAVACDFPVY